MLLALCSGARAAQAQSVDPAQPSYVDLMAVYEAYKKTAPFTRFERQLREQESRFAEELRLLAQVRYCTEAERREALQLKTKEQSTAQEKARLDALIKKSADVEAELARLSQKTMPSEDEILRIEELSRMRQDAARLIAREEDERRQRLVQMDQEAAREHQAELLKLVERVAREKKIPAILERSAVLFGGNDLTDDVIKKLPK